MPKSTRRSPLDSKLSPSRVDANGATRVRGLRMDDIGAATKRNEIYGRTRIPLGSLQIPFPGDPLFLKCMCLAYESGDLTTK